jgi:uncharacterized membrane protein
VTVAATAVFVAGLLLIAGGAWLVYRPAGYITGGALLVLVAVLWVRGDMAARRRSG